ncbi:hypothetical protein Golax_003505, partial [Gossypium laxum]|nr:hypothetical protein [Gossypium laxum]
MNSVHQVVLGWPTRLQIVVAAAQGLCYMQAECLTPIIHHDVKSSNLFLSSEFNAKSSNFGLAMMLTRHASSRTMSAVVRSFGYLACLLRATTSDEIDQSNCQYVRFVQPNLRNKANFHTLHEEFHQRIGLQVSKDQIAAGISVASLLLETSNVFKDLHEIISDCKEIVVRLKDDQDSIPVAVGISLENLLSLISTLDIFHASLLDQYEDMTRKARNIQDYEILNHESVFFIIK